MRRCSLKKSVLFLALFVPFLAVHAAVDNGYEVSNNIAGTCPVNKDVQPDAWGFAACNCTSYVAYRLNLNNVRLNGNGVLFKNDWTGGVHFGYAYHWNDAAADVGIREDSYPAIGAVAHWEKAGGTGHVAYVQRLYTSETDGRLTRIDVVEYNWPADRKYHTNHDYESLSVGGPGYPERFLHFEAMGRDANIPGSDTATNVTCVTGLSVKPSGAHDGVFCWKHDGNNAKCENASAYYYFDYQTCRKYEVGSSYCSSVGNNRGYTVHIGSGFPEPIDSAHRGHGFAACGAAGTAAYGGVSEEKHSNILKLLYP